MKKFIKITILNILIIMIVVFCFVLVINNHEKKRYLEIKNSFNDAVHKEIDATFVVKDYYNCNIAVNNYKISDEFLISQGYLKKSDMLDIDKVNYCTGHANVSMGKNCNLKYKSYIKCKRGII